MVFPARILNIRCTYYIVDVNKRIYGNVYIKLFHCFFLPVLIFFNCFWMHDNVLLSSDTKRITLIGLSLPATMFAASLQMMLAKSCFFKCFGMYKETELSKSISSELNILNNILRNNCCSASSPVFQRGSINRIM